MLWAFAELFHLLGNPSDLADLLTGTVTATSVVAWLVAAAAAVVLVRPGPGLAGRPFLVLCILSVVDLVVSAPLVGNHQMILALGSLLLAVTVRRSSPALASPSASVVSAVAGLRWLLLIAYGMIAFSKLNTDYLNPVVSCAVVFSDEMSEWFGLSVSDSLAASRVAIYGSLLAELAVPVTLVVRPLRRYGVLLALGFHGLLSLEPAGHVYDFTATLMPFFLLFAPPQAQARLTALFEPLQRRVSAAAACAAVAIVMLLNLIVIGVGLPAWLVAYPLWLIYLVAVLWAVTPALLRSADNSDPAGGSDGDQPTRWMGGRPGLAALAVLGLALVNGVSPYLQLKNATAFNMYSNLRVVDQQSNHLVVPPGPAIRAPELFAVEVSGSNEPLSFYPERSLAVPLANLVAYAESETSAAVVQVRPVRVDAISTGSTDTARRALGEIVTETDGDEGPLGRLGAVVSRSFGLWRSVDVDGPAQCLRVWGPAY